MDIGSYIKDLSPELQEKARACGSVEELLALAKENKIPLPDEALAAIAGGEDSKSGNCLKITCPKCGCTRIGYQEEYTRHYRHDHFVCTGCGYEWDYYDPIDV